MDEVGARLPCELEELITLTLGNIPVNAGFLQFWLSEVWRNVAVHRDFHAVVFHRPFEGLDVLDAFEFVHDGERPCVTGGDLHVLLADWQLVDEQLTVDPLRERELFIAFRHYVGTQFEDGEREDRAHDEHVHVEPKLASRRPTDLPNDVSDRCPVPICQDHLLTWTTKISIE